MKGLKPNCTFEMREGTLRSGRKERREVEGKQEEGGAMKEAEQRRQEEKGNEKNGKLAHVKNLKTMRERRERELGKELKNMELAGTATGGK